MTAQTVTIKGQVTLRRELLRHLGIKPGERIEFDMLPGGELRVRAVRPTRTIDDFLAIFEGKTGGTGVLSIQDMNEIAAAGWAGELDRG